MQSYSNNGLHMQTILFKINVIIKSIEGRHMKTTVAIYIKSSQVSGK
jgi:hypothetical protein